MISNCIIKRGDGLVRFMGHLITGQMGCGGRCQTDGRRRASLLANRAAAATKAVLARATRGTTSGARYRLEAAGSASKALTRTVEPTARLELACGALSIALETVHATCACLEFA